MTTIQAEKHPTVSPGRVLLIEDSPGDASLVMSALSKPSHLFEVHWTMSLEDATSRLTGSHFDCLLVDLGLPDGDGLDVVDTIKNAAPSKEVTS